MAAGSRHELVVRPGPPIYRGRGVCPGYEGTIGATEPVGKPQRPGRPREEEDRTMRVTTALRRSLVLIPFVLACASPVAAAAEPATSPRLPELALESYTLANGLKVALHRDPTVPCVTVCVAYHVGSKNEKAGRTGFAHFFEH